MKTEKMIEAVKDIKMPQNMQERIISNCQKEVEVNYMSKNTTKSLFKRPMVAVAALALCFCLTGVTALAATGKLQGFFKDIIGWNGAVTGTSYEQATDEIEMSIVEVSDILTVELEMVNPDVAPYSVFDTFGIKEYKIMDVNGNVITENKETEMVELADGKVNVCISLEGVSSGEYKLVVNKLVGSAKADQPLEISGIWECTFTR